MIDLHIHTTFSDGTYTPSEIIDMSLKKGLKIISITDHDTLEGIISANERAEKERIKIIPGIEFSTDYDGKEIHILGYFIDVKNEKLNIRLKELKKDREERTLKILEKLKGYRINITMDDIQKEVTGNLISRTHIASAMYKKGYVFSRKEAFLRYIGAGGAAYVQKENISPGEAVRIIKESGGLAFLAHPKFIPYGEKKIKELIQELKKDGLDGIEVYYYGHEKKDIEYYKRIAEEFGLIMSGGSDFHGGNREEVELGEVFVPDEVYEKMIERMESK